MQHTFKTFGSHIGRWQRNHLLFYALLQRKTLFEASARNFIAVDKCVLFSISSLSFLTKKYQKFLKNNYNSTIKTMDNSRSIFQGNIDRFNGVTVDSEKEYIDSNEFADKLKFSLAVWSENKKRCIWFKVRTAHADWIPHLTKNGFEFHHAKKGYTILYRWLPTDEIPNLPVFAHTMVGVGGIVVNDKNEILVISDKHGLIPNSWKLPGGFVEPGENLVDAAIREVQEETGVITTFETVVCLRHSHKGSFGCSDMYVVIALRPQTSLLIPCEREISRIQWMPCEEYLNDPNVHETNRMFLRTLLSYRQRGVNICCQNAVHSILKKEYNLYFIENKEN